MKIDVSEKFQHLPRAPIVEAVIQITARAEAPWEEKAITSVLKPKLPAYPKVVSRSNIRHQVKLSGTDLAQASKEDLGWHGLLFQSEDERQVAQFNRDGFVFSRVRPYDCWEQLFSEAMLLWRTYFEVARPAEAQRIGLRFINRIGLPREGVKLRDFIQRYPESPSGLESTFFGFFHQDTLAIPEYPYAVNVIRTIQPPEDPNAEGSGLILDIDAFSTQPFELKEGMIESRLMELRWLKNKAFFGSITPRTLELFQ